MLKTRWVLAFAFCVPAMARTSAVPPAAVEQSIQGQLIDQTCYLKDPRTIVDAAHLECAAICAKRGAPLALLTAEGTIYVVAGDLAKNNGLKLRPYVGQKVEVTGRLLQQRGGKLYLGAAPDVTIRGRILQERDGLIIEGREIRRLTTAG